VSSVQAPAELEGDVDLARTGGRQAGAGVMNISQVPATSTNVVWGGAHWLRRKNATSHCLHWISSHGFRDWVYFASPRRNGRAVLMDGSVLNDESALFEPRVQVLADGRLLGVDPDDQQAFGA
jgi:hypothetical protein